MIVEIEKPVALTIKLEGNQAITVYFERDADKTAFIEDLQIVHEELRDLRSWWRLVQGSRVGQ